MIAFREIGYTLLLFILITNISCSFNNQKLLIDSHKPFFIIHPLLFKGERFPNVVVSKKGTVIATIGRENFVVKRSENGGITWSDNILVHQPGFHGGGVISDEVSGDILVFMDDKHPPTPGKMFRSKDDGKTWKEEPLSITPDSKGNMPSLHMNEHGIILKFGKHKGRLIRPTRYYGQGNDVNYWDQHYTNAIYSDDRGKSWKTSEPFPVMGTGEACIEQLSDGRLYYNSRRHKSTDGLDPRWRYEAWSEDGGHTWQNMNVSKVLPDGNQYSDYGLMGGLTRISTVDGDVLVFSNIDIPKTADQKDLAFENRWGDRRNGAVWLSRDGAKSWPVKKVIDSGGFAYSSLYAGRPGTPTEGLIYLLYEKIENGQYVGANMAIFNLPWLESK
ncbi:MAG: exo-alpha-sialidase [Saprospiraceae bacterium]|jgi:sialidase-1|nr:exo-alpha-sialidase [Saprospiraceae bacterium]